MTVESIREVAEQDDDLESIREVAEQDDDRSQEEGTFVSQPGRLMRIASVARAMLDEARDTPCDEAGCEQFRNIYEQTFEELGSLLSDDLRGELEHLRVTFNLPSPSPSKLRVAQAELVGWLEGLFQGIVAATNGQAEEAAAQAEAVAEATGSDLEHMPGNYI